MKIRIISLIFILLLSLLAGCSGHPDPPEKKGVNQESQQQAGNQKQSAEEKPLEPELPPWPGDSSLNKQDQTFKTKMTESMKYSAIIMAKVEEDLAEAEDNDELDEGIDIMNKARQDILAKWNEIHEAAAPDHPSLKRIKQLYEDVLVKYREGLAIELDGMKTEDIKKMKEGYQLTTTARDTLERWTRQKDF